MSMTKYYRVKQDNFMWQKGAILESNDQGSKGGYQPVDNTDLWDTTDLNGDEFISKRIIENSPEWFERVYKVNLLKRAVYVLKDKAKELLDRDYDVS